MPLRRFTTRLLVALALVTSSFPSEAAWQFRVQNGTGASGVSPAAVPVVQPSDAWVGATEDGTYTLRAGKGFFANPLPADPGNTIQTVAGLPQNYERAVANWSEPDDEIVSAEDSPGGKFRMGIQAYHQTGINHIDVFVEGNGGNGSPSSKITIQGADLTNLVRTDPVTGKTWTNSNFFVFDVAMPAPTTKGGTIQLVADVYPNVGFPVRLGQYGAYSMLPASFSPLLLFFDPNNTVAWDTYCIAPSTGGTTSPGVIGDDTKGGRCPEAGGTPFASFSKFRQGITNNKPTKLLAYDGSYLEDNASVGSATTPRRPPVWVRFKENRLGPVFGRKTFALTDPNFGATTAYGYVKYQLDMQWDGISYNPANVVAWTVGSYRFVPYTMIFKRSRVAADYGINAQGVNRNGPGQAYSANGPRVDEQYGIYWPIGYSFGTPGGVQDKVQNSDAFIQGARGSFLESEYYNQQGPNGHFSRNSVFNSGNSDLVDLGAESNVNMFGNTLITGETGVALQGRSTGQQVLKVGTIDYNVTTPGKTTIVFQDDASGNAIKLGTRNAFGPAIWVLDPSSPYYYTRYNTAGYGDIGGATCYPPGVGGFTKFGCTSSIDLTGGLSPGSAVVVAGEAHNDFIQGTAGRRSQTPPTTTQISANLPENIILAANTWLGRPSQVSTFSVGDGKLNPVTYTYNPDGTVNTGVTSASLLCVDADGRNFHTVDPSGNDLPVQQMIRGWPINVPFPTGKIPNGSSAGVLFYNNTNGTVTDPIYGTFAKGHGIFGAPLMNQDGTPWKYGGTACATYKTSIGFINMAWVNNIFSPDLLPAYSFAAAQENFIFVGNTHFSSALANTVYNPPAYAAPGSTYSDNVIRLPLPYTPDFKMTGNSFGFSTGLTVPSGNVYEPSMAMPARSTWVDALVPPLPTRVTQKAAGSPVRKFDRYGNPVVPGFSPPGARAQ